MNQKLIEGCMKSIIREGLGLDLSDPNLSGTPRRVAKMWTKEFFQNINREFPAKNFRMFPNEEGYDEIVLFDQISFVSVCSHHFLPFQGSAWFAYIPKDKLVGASKPARLVEWYAARPQLQERLAHQIVERFDTIVKPKGTLLVMRAVHGCMSCRGVKQGNKAGMTTSIVKGVFKKNLDAKLEAFELIKIAKVGS